LIRQEDDNETPISVVAQWTDTRARDLISVISRYSWTNDGN